MTSTTQDLNANEKDTARHQLAKAALKRPLRWPAQKMSKFHEASLPTLALPEGNVTILKHSTIS